MISVDNTPGLALLSVMMKSAADAYAVVSAGVTESAFESEDERRLFLAILAAAADMKDTGPAAILAHAQGSGMSPTWLIAVEDMQPTASFRTQLTETVLDAQRTRRLRDAIAGAAIAAKGEESTWEALWSEVAPHIEAAQNSASTNHARSLASFCEEAAEQIEKPETRRITRCGIPAWDDVATPMKAGEMIALAARPGCGKTALAGQMAHAVAKAGGRVAFFSLEMSGGELATRMGLVRSGREGLFDQRNLVRAIRSLAEVKTLHVFDNSQRYTMAAIEARCRLLATQSGGLSLVVVDYLQLVTPSDLRAPREQQVAEMSRRFKELAGSLKCPVMVLAQLNRESEKEERRPRLSDLRESGAIEQDSDRVWFLWRDPKTIQGGVEDEQAIEIITIQAKCRGGPPNVAKAMRFDRPIYTFTPITYTR
jgi:replicative DNA helicase